MKKNPLLVTLLLIALLGALLSACAAPPAEAPAVEVEEPVAEVEEPAAEEPVVEATEEVAEPTAVPVADLDGAFTMFIANMESYNMVEPAAVNEMLAEEPPFLLDVRQPEEVEADGFIEGAVHIPVRDLTANLDKLPAMDAPIVVYCGSGWRSNIAMTTLETLGWTNVTSMKGGFAAWKEAELPVVTGTPVEAESLGTYELDPMLVCKFDTMLSELPEGWSVIAPEALAEMLAENPDIILIDVRTADEVASSGTIEGALTIPLEELMARRAEWPTAKDATIVTYCKVGGRGVIAMSILRTYGYTNVGNLKGGIDGWIAAGNPVAAN